MTILKLQFKLLGLGYVQCLRCLKYLIDDDTQFDPTNRLSRVEALRNWHRRTLKHRQIQHQNQKLKNKYHF